MPKPVKIEWCWLEWEPGYTWKKKIVPQLNEVGLSEVDTNRCVYVIRANGNFAIEYPNGISPTLYIGEGNLASRLSKHKEWLEPIRDLVGDFAFEVGVCIPRVRNNFVAYQDFEAALLSEFRSIYGCAPIRNGQMESQKFSYEFVPRSEIRSALMIGRGNRFQWALKPMRSSGLFQEYWKTHETS